MVCGYVVGVFVVTYRHCMDTGETALNVTVGDDDVEVGQSLWFCCVVVEEEHRLTKLPDRTALLYCKQPWCNCCLLLVPISKQYCLTVLPDCAAWVYCLVVLPAAGAAVGCCWCQLGGSKIETSQDNPTSECVCYTVVVRSYVITCYNNFKCL
jgi:hypothetical protein